MDTLQQGLAIGVAIIAILTAFAVALVIFRGSYSKAKIEALIRDVDIYKNREDLHEREMVDCKERIALLEEKVSHLEGENALLREEVTQKARVEELARDTREMHIDNMAMNEQILIAIQSARAEFLGAVQELRVT